MSAPRERPVVAVETAVREARTLRDLVRHAVTRFEAAGLAYGHGTDNAWDEAVALLLWALHLPPDRLESFLDARLAGAERRAALALVEERVRTRVPAAYLTGEAWLRGLSFACDARAPVPRSLLAEVLDEALPAWLEVHGRAGGWPADVLDLCTGGASLAVLAADRLPGARVCAADLSADALALAAENLARHGLGERITLHRGDLFAAVAGRRYDLVLCNPPYVNEESMRRLPPEFRSEPRTALAGGIDGMDIVRRVLAQAPAHLTRDGVLVLEIGHEAGHFEAAFPALEYHYLPVAAGVRMVVLVEAAQLGVGSGSRDSAAAAPASVSRTTGRARRRRLPTA